MDKAPPPLAELVRRTRGPRPWRRTLHLVGGSSVAWVAHVLSPQSASARWLFGIMLVAALSGDFLRLRSEPFNRFVFRTFGVLMCPHEVDRPSITWFLSGVFVVLWFPAEAQVVAALLVLAIADPVANVVGGRLGRHRVGKGTVEGTAAFTVAAFAVLWPFVGVWRAFVVAMVAAAFEAFVRRLDDNLVIPVVTAVGIWVVGRV